MNPEIQIPNKKTLDDFITFMTFTTLSDDIIEYLFAASYSEEQIHEILTSKREVVEWMKKLRQNESEVIE